MKLLAKSIKFAGLATITLSLFVCVSILSARYFDAHSFPPAPSGASFVLDNVNLIPVSQSGVVRKQQLLILEGQIADIRAADTPVTNGLPIIDTGGAYVMPGMFDMHVHIDDRQQLKLALTYGVTSVRNMDGMPIHLRWKRELENGEWVGASLYSASPSMRGAMFSTPVDVRVMGKEHAEALVSTFKEQGWDQIKVYSGLGYDEFLAVLEKSRTLGIDVVGHIPHSVVGVNYPLAGEMKSIEHAEEVFQGPLKYEFDDVGLSAIARQLSEAGAVVCPTLITFEHLTKMSEEKQIYANSLNTDFMTPFGKQFSQLTEINRWFDVSAERAAYNRKEFDFLKTIVSRLHENNVQFIAGTDAGTYFVQPGASMSEELLLMHDAGVDAQSILEAATINSARVLGVDDKLGTIEVGKGADLVLFQRNPLIDISVTGSPKMVIKNGVVFNEASIFEMRNETKNVAGWWKSLGRYMEAVFSRLSYRY